MGIAESKSEMLWNACGYGRVEQVKELLKHPAILVNYKSNIHNSCPIHACCAAASDQGQKEILLMLIEKKCNIDPKDERGCIPLHHACMKGHADFVETLLDHGSEINTQDRNGWTPLMTAAYWCNSECLRILLNYGASVELKNKDKRTALHEVCRSQSRDEKQIEFIVKYLIKAGCNINEKSSEDGEADFNGIMYAVYHNHIGAVKSLIEAGCNLNIQGVNGWSALHWAVDKNNRYLINLLLQSGINKNLRNKMNQLAEDRTEEEELQNYIRDFKLPISDVAIQTVAQNYIELGNNERKTRVDILKDNYRHQDYSPARSTVSTMSPPSSIENSIEDLTKITTYN